MNVINIKGLKIYARHGVLPEEKKAEQPFVFDVELKTDFFSAAEGDDLSKTVNYAEVCSLIDKTARGATYNLIEKLAYECAFAIMENFPVVSGVKVTVNKPEAPVKLTFETVGVTAELSRERVILSLGSSIGDGEKLITAALKSLGEERGITIKKISSFIVTEPYGGVAKNKFVNCAAETECLFPPERLLSVIHRIEEEGGRKRDVRWGDRTLDIDVVFFGSRIIRENGLSVPHPDYANRPFVIIPVKEIAPDFICPVTGKRMSDL